MKLFNKALAVALFLIPACYADTVTVFFTALPATLENGSYNGFSTATVNGIPNQLLMCDDYNDDTYMPSSSNLVYDYSSLEGADPLQYAMFATSTSEANTLKYEEAAVLVYELAQLGSGATADQSTDFNYALWNLMNPSAPLDPSRASQEQTLQSNALALVNNPADTASLDSTAYAYTRIYTPTAAYKGNQEFLEYATPEPNLAWGAGVLLILGLVFGRRFSGAN